MGRRVGKGKGHADSIGSYRLMDIVRNCKLEKWNVHLFTHQVEI